MNRNLASTLIVTGTAAAALALAAMSTVAHADDITIDPNPFVSTKSRAQVRAEVIGRAEEIRMAHAEAPMEMNRAPFRSTLTRAQVREEYMASRNEVKAFTSEDSGSAYLASRQPRRSDLMMAGTER